MHQPVFARTRFSKEIYERAARRPVELVEIEKLAPEKGVVQKTQPGSATK